MCPHQSGYQRNRRRVRHVNLVARLRRQPAAPSLEAVRAYDLLHHADGQALLEAAELAAVAPPLVHRTVFVG